MKQRRSAEMWSLDGFRELLPKNIGVFGVMFSSLKIRNFRLYFLGQCISLCGTWIQFVALGWLVYRLTGSVLLLTTVALVNQLPALIITPFAGAISDRINRYKLILYTQFLFMGQALVLTTLVLTKVISESSDAWMLIVLTGFNGLVAAVEAPSRQAFYSKLVPKEQMSNAIALNSVTINGARFIGPTIGGLLIAAIGEGFCFMINTLSYVSVIVALLMINVDDQVVVRTKESILKSVREGLVYVGGALPLKTVLIFVATMSFFTLPFMNIIPVLVKDVLGGDSTLLGYMNSSVGAGALSAALYLAMRKRTQGLGRVLTLTASILGLSFIILAFTKSPVVACVVAYPLGFAMIGSMATSNTLLQTMVEESKRGRVMSLYTMAFTGMNPLGGMLYAPMIEKFSLSWVFFSVGIICFITVIIYEYYRPMVRKAVSDKECCGGVMAEIAESMSNTSVNPF